MEGRVRGKEAPVGRWEAVRDRVSYLRRFFRRLHPPDSQLPVPAVPEGRVVNVPDRGEMFLRQADGPREGPTILLLHGWTLSADLNWFTGVYEEAARHGPVVAPDVRGHGRGLRSDQDFTLEAATDDVAALIRHLELDPVIAVGYSMGGSMALLLWQRHPELVSGLVLAATGLQWRSNLWERVVWTAMSFVEYGMRLGAPEGGLADRYLREAAAESPELEQSQGWIKGEIRRGDAADIAAAARSLSTFDARPFAGDIDVPAAVVVTKGDRLIRRKRQEELAGAIPDAHKVELEGQHNSWLVRPAEFAEATGEAIRLVAEGCRSRSGGARDDGGNKAPEGQGGAEA